MSASEVQGTSFDDRVTDPEKMIRNVPNRHLTPEAQRQQLDLIQNHNRSHEQSVGGDEVLEGCFRAPETAFRMQTEATDAFDTRNEPVRVHEEYESTRFANGCLLARRSWSGASAPFTSTSGRGNRGTTTAASINIPRPAARTWTAPSRPSSPTRSAAAYSTGPPSSGRANSGGRPSPKIGDGRDPNPDGSTLAMVGGGFKGGVRHGATDEFGFRAVENRVSVHDLHATLLHVLGIDHEKLTYRFAGRDFRLTDVFGTVVRDLLR